MYLVSNSYVHINLPILHEQTSIGKAYRQFMTEKDYELERWVLDFNQFDLYTKDQAGLQCPVEELWPYYQSLIEKYFPSDVLVW